MKLFAIFSFILTLSKMGKLSYFKVGSLAKEVKSLNVGLMEAHEIRDELIPGKELGELSH